MLEQAMNLVSFLASLITISNTVKEFSDADRAELVRVTAHGLDSAISIKVIHDYTHSVILLTNEITRKTGDVQFGEVQIASQRLLLNLNNLREKMKDLSSTIYDAVEMNVVRDSWLSPVIANSLITSLPERIQSMRNLFPRIIEYYSLLEKYSESLRQSSYAPGRDFDPLRQLANDMFYTLNRILDDADKTLHIYLGFYTRVLSQAR